MTRLDYIKNLPAEDLAEWMVFGCDLDDSNGSLECNEMFYYCSDGSCFDDYDEAVKYEIEWLKEEK